MTPSTVFCDGKERFDSKGKEEQIRSKSARRREVGLSTYRCTACGGWHIGSHLSRKKVTK